LEFINNEQKKYKNKEESVFPSLENIRDNIVIANRDLTPETEWISDIPYDVRQNAIVSVLGALESAKTNVRNGHQKHFELHFLTKKSKKDICYFPDGAIKKGFRIAPTRLKKKSRLKFRKKMRRWLNRQTFKGGFSVQRNQANQYYLGLRCKPGAVKYKKEGDARRNMVSLDPGVCIFQTYYSEDECGLIGGDYLLKKLHKRLDHLTRVKSTNKKTRYHIKRRCSLLRIKITNIIRDLHWKTASFLTKNFKTILIPTFKTQQMAMKSQNPKLNRNMITMAHFTFKERLKYMGKKHGSVIIDCSEAWTTATCGNCGKIQEIKGREYKCRACAMHINRDVNGARNILIRSLTTCFK
jgi:putative transposase